VSHREESGTVMCGISITELNARSCGRENGFSSAKSVRFPTLALFLIDFTHSHFHTHILRSISSCAWWSLVTRIPSACAVQKMRGTGYLVACRFSVIGDNRLIWDLPLIPFRDRCSLGSFASLFCLTL